MPPRSYILREVANRAPEEQRDANAIDTDASRLSVEFQNVHASVKNLPFYLKLTKHPFIQNVSPWLPGSGSGTRFIRPLYSGCEGSRASSVSSHAF